MQWAAECLPQTCRSFTNLIFLKLQEAKSVNTGTVVLQSLAGSQPWSRRQGLCCCLSVKGASEWLQHPESLIWEEGSGMWPQAWSPGEKAARGSETGHAWEQGKRYLKLNTITGTVRATLWFSTALTCAPLHLKEGGLPIKTHCNLVLNGSLEPSSAFRGGGCEHHQDTVAKT